MPRKKTNGKMNSEAAALDWLELGIKPIPIWPGQKKPRGTSWQKLRLTANTLSDYFHDGDNIGGLWGRPSGWIVDVDLDDDHAADLAEFLLPKTFTFGRASRPETHYLYHCKGVKTAKWIDTNKKAIVELRSTGAQTVLPPSIHPDKERYITDDRNDEEFTSMSRIKLMKYLNEIAAGALFMRNYPEGGGRHDYVHAMTGALLYSKWKGPEARRFCRAIVHAVGPVEDDPKQRLRTIDNTIEHHKQGHRVQGWKTLKEFVDPKEVQLMRRWLDSKDSEASPTPEKLTILTPGRATNFDRKLLQVPGLVGDLIKWSAKHSYIHQPPFDLATALMCTALATCNHYEVDNWQTPLQPYFMLLAPTAQGKGASLERVFDFATKAGIGDYVFSHFQSYHSMMDQLAESPNMVCWLWDEAARHLKSARNPSSMDFQILSHLISLYGRANKFVPGVAGRKNPIPALDNPFLTLFATAQPQQLIEAAGDEDNIATGFVNRFLLFDSGDELPNRNTQRSSIFPSALKKASKALTSHVPKGGRTTIRFAGTEAFTLMDDYAETSRKRLGAGSSGHVYGRAAQNALIVAGIVSVGVNPKRPQITAEIASWALKLVSWSVETWLARIDEMSSGTFREKYSKKVESMIRNPKDLVTKRTRPRQLDLLKKGLVPKSVLTLKLRSLNGREIEDILEQLLVMGLIGMTERDEDGITVYWPKR